MRGDINLTINISDTIKKVGVDRELQILTDGLLARTINILNSRQTIIEYLEVVDNTMITIELRDVYDNGGMSAPLIYEFVVVDGIPQPQSDIFQVTVTQATSE